MATEARETVDLIGSDKVEGTAVYDANGEHIGSIERVMIEKRSGQVAYAVLSLAASWASAATTIRSPGTPSSMTPALVGTAPTSPRSSSKVRRSTQGDTWDWEDRERRRKVYDYYDTPWMEH